MNYQVIDLLDKVIAKETENDLALLRKEGVLTSEGQIERNKLNLMSGAYASDLLDGVVEANMNTTEVIEYIEGLQRQNQFMGIYFFLLILLSALDMDIPYLFMQLPSNTEVLRIYIGELIADMKDYSLDLIQEE
jgi:hypothetical protein